MATTVHIYVDPDATGTGDGTSWTDAYTSLATAHAARDANIVTADEIHHYHCRASSGGNDSAACELGGGSYTLDSTHYVILEGDFAGTQWDTSKYHREITDARALQIVGRYVRVFGVQLGVTGATAAGKSPLQIGVAAGGTEIEIHHNLIRSATEDYWKWVIAASDADITGLKIWNNILWNRVGTPQSSDTLIYLNGASIVAYVYNNTCYGGSIGIRRVAGSVTAINNIVQGTDTESFLGTFEAASGYNISDDTTDTDAATDQNSVTLDFVDLANGDFALASTDTEAIAAGDDLDEDADCPVTDDIEGTSRDPDNPCIGAHEYVAAGGTTLTADALTLGAPVLGSPAISQVHALTASALTMGAPLLGTPALSQVHALLADGLLVGAPVLGAPALGVQHVLAADGIALGAPVFGTPALVQVHVLVADALTMGAPVLGTPALASGDDYYLTANALTAGVPVLGTPALAQLHVLLATGLAAGAPVLGTPALAQVHILSADPILIGAPVLGTPAIILYRISGLTRDSAGAALGTCVVQLFRTTDDAIIQEKVSGGDGSFFFDVADDTTEYYIVAYKAGAPDRAGTTVNTLVGAVPGP